MLESAKNIHSQLPLPFLREAIRNPIKTGALLPSSQGLAREMTRYMPVGGSKLVVELGPGTGAFTHRIASRLQENRFIALELNQALHRTLQRRFPHLDLLNESAENLGPILQRRNLGPVDLVVSGLPWAVFRHQSQKTLLEGTYEAMAENGVFSTFAYVHALPIPSARRFRTLLESVFEQVQTSRVIWRNMPPAIAYHCFKSRHPQAAH